MKFDHSFFLLGMFIVALTQRFLHAVMRGIFDISVIGHLILKQNLGRENKKHDILNEISASYSIPENRLRNPTFLSFWLSLRHAIFLVVGASSALAGAAFEQHTQRNAAIVALIASVPHAG